MNKIFKLTITNDLINIEIAKALLEKSPHLEPHLLNILNYLGPRGKGTCHGIFHLDEINEDGQGDKSYVLYQALDRLVGIKRKYIVIADRSPEGDLFEEAKESLKILMNEQNI